MDAMEIFWEGIGKEEGKDGRVWDLGFRNLKPKDVWHQNASLRCQGPGSVWAYLG